MYNLRTAIEYLKRDNRSTSDARKRLQTSVHLNNKTIHYTERSTCGYNFVSDLGTYIIKSVQMNSRQYLITCEGGKIFNLSYGMFDSLLERGHAHDHTIVNHRALVTRLEVID
jgi:hypothetical protein